MSNHLNKLAAEFNRYFTSSNGIDVPAKVSVSRDEWRALFTAIQQAESEPVILWQYRWLNPGNKADASPQELAWKNVDHAWPHLDIASQVESLKGYRFGGKPSYEVRALFTHPAPGVPTVPAAALDRLMALLETQAAQIIELEDSRDAEPGVPDDVVRDAERYRWLRSLEHCNEAWCFIGSGNANSNLDAAIDAAMLTAAQAQKGQP